MIDHSRKFARSAPLFGFQNYIARRWLGRAQGFELVAFEKFLYLVRCNLVHGSKAEMGDDEQIIETSIGPLELLLEIAIDFTERQPSFNTGY